MGSRGSIEFAPVRIIRAVSELARWPRWTLGAVSFAGFDMDQVDGRLKEKAGDKPNLFVVPPERSG